MLFINLILNHLIFTRFPVGTHFKGTKKEEAALNAYIKLMRAAGSISARLARKREKSHLTLSQFGALEALLHLGPLNQKQLGEKMLTSGGNVVHIVDNLERAGLVERRKCKEDRRRMILHLTPEGKRVITKEFQQHLTDVMDEFETLSVKDLLQLGELCKKAGLKR